MFFSFLAVFPLPESYQNDPKFHFNTLLRSDTQKSSKNVENTTVFWSRCETVFGPPPAKADIATAILTNVIEHLVLLLPPNKHAFTAKAVWADFSSYTLTFMLKKLSQHTTPIAKFRISVDANLVLSGRPFYSKKIPFLQYHQNTTGTPPKHHRNTTKTWARLLGLEERLWPDVMTGMAC